MTVTLVTGGAGYLGGVLVPALRESGRHVVVVDPLWYGPAPWNPGSGLDVVRRDSRDLTAGDLSSVDEIVDLAAVSSEHAAARLPSLAWAVNDAARRRLAGLASRVGVRRYVLPSSSNVYGAGATPFTEDAPVTADSTYAAANRSAEVHVLALADRRFSPAVLRQATVYGWSPHLRHDLVVNAMTADVLETGGCRVQGDGRQRRPLVWIRDLARIHVRLLETEAPRISGQILNAGAPAEQHRIGELPGRIGAQLGVVPRITNYDAVDRKSHLLSYARLRDRIGIEVGPSLDDGVAELARALRAAPLDAAAQRVRRSDWLARQVELCG